jgi:capsular exopolysaccharide synthesis family protein
VSPPQPDSSSSDWLRPSLAQPGLRGFVQTIRERMRLVVLVLVLVLTMAAAYLVTADKVYEAQSDILVTPVPTQEAVLSTVGVITQSADPTLDVETANQLIDSPAVANRAAAALDDGESGDSLLAAVSVAPIPESNIVTVTASGPSPESAAARANAFAAAAIAERRQTIAANIDAVLPQLRSDLATEANEGSIEAISDTIAALVAFRASGNATMQVETAAAEPASPSSPRTTLVLVAALIGGLALGVGAAFAAQTLDPRLRREEQLRALYSLPILARIPRERSRPGPLTPERLSPMGREGYRTLRAAVAASSRDEHGPRSILVGGSGPSEGKSTTAINLAASLALAGHSVILIGADLRRPVIDKALGVEGSHGVVSVLLGRATLADALVPVSAYNDQLKVLVADEVGTDFADLFSLPAAKRLLEEADRLADYVIVDSPPLGDVVDALQLAQHVDAVVLVVHLGISRIKKIRELAELLASSGIRPIGFALLGAPRAGRESYAYYSEPSGQRSPEAPLSTR